MSISSKKSENGREVEIAISGRFDFSMHKEFRNVYQDNGPDIGYVIDMRFAEYMDSSALGMLLLLREHVKLDRNKLHIKNCPPAIMSVLKIANLDKMINIS